MFTYNFTYRVLLALWPLFTRKGVLNCWKECEAQVNLTGSCLVFAVVDSTWCHSKATPDDHEIGEAMRKESHRQTMKHVFHVKDVIASSEIWTLIRLKQLDLRCKSTWIGKEWELIVPQSSESESTRLQQHLRLFGRLKYDVGSLIGSQESCLSSWFWGSDIYCNTVRCKSNFLKAEFFWLLASGAALPCSVPALPSNMVPTNRC